MPYTSPLPESCSSCSFHFTQHQSCCTWNTKHYFACVRIALRVRSLNGRDLGVAFAGFEMGGLYPAASMNVGQGAHFNFGHAPFLFPPIRDGASSLQPVSEALAANDATRPNSADSARSCQLPVRGIDGEDAESAGDGDEHHREVSLGRVRGTNVAVGTGDGQAFSTSGEDGQEREGEDVSQLPIERQALVENLIAMGFPVEWAIRAAGKPGK